ncbi:S-methyl-5'-thioadenosine phosphorylase [Desulfovibrio caledoniensis]
MSKIGIIGGSGLDNPDLLQDVRDVEMGTPYGKPSALLQEGTIAGREVVLLARHGRAHTIPPTFVNYRANIKALKDAGCTRILATTACGSLRQEIERGHLVILDQFIDFTRRRQVSFFDEFEPHCAVHTAMADPFDADMRGKLNAACDRLGLAHHKSGTVITIEGSRFSTRAESNMFRLWGADVINMSVAPECILANEAGIPYAAVAMSTDYDCWKTDEAPVTWEEILDVFKSNVEKVTSLLVEVIKDLD